MGIYKGRGAEVGTMEGGRVLISLEPARAFHLCNSKMQVSSCHLKTPILVIIVALQIPRQMDGNNNN
jgi:hypothetical protein